MKSNNEILEELDEHLGKGGPLKTVIMGFVESHLKNRDKEWREKMIEVLEGAPVKTSDCIYCNQPYDDAKHRNYDGQMTCDLEIVREDILWDEIGYNKHVKEVETWQQEQANKLKQL